MSIGHPASQLSAGLCHGVPDTTFSIQHCSVFVVVIIQPFSPVVNRLLSIFSCYISKLSFTKCNLIYYNVLLEKFFFTPESGQSFAAAPERRRL